MIADLKPYPAMKHSGVPWLGEVPEHWEVKRLKHACRLAYGDALASESRRDGDVPVYGSNGRVGSHSVPNTRQPCLVIGRKGSFGKVNFSSEPVFAIDTTYYVDSRTSSADIRWLYYLLGWLRLDEVSRSSAIPGLDREEAYQRIAAIPPLPEQSAIVRFLDYADRRIRRYVRAKQKLIKLLEEQKQAIIHRAVTRGLDPGVRLKPSGVEWLGDVPEHWAITRLKFVAPQIVDCLHATPVYSDGGAYPAIRTADVRPGELLMHSVRRVDEEHYRQWTARMAPSEGDILYTREGERFGVAALVPAGVRLCISQRMMAFRIHENQNSAYIMWQINCQHVYAQAAADLIGAAAPHVNVARIRNFEITIPPRSEQDAIVLAVEEAIGRPTAAIQRARDEIALLREYRTRLIADVVTGKLDVREAAARLPDEVEEPEPLDLIDAEGDTDEAFADDADAVPEKAEA